MTTAPGDDAVRRPVTGKLGRRRDGKQPLPAWQEALLLVGTAIVLSLLIKTFLLQAFYIPSGSMGDTLQVDDRIVVQKWSYWSGDVHRGDIVVFDDPASWLGEEDGQAPSNPVSKSLALIGLYPAGGHLVKRVVGVGGDRVSCADGAVVVNGDSLIEDSYVTRTRQGCRGQWQVEVPTDRLWVLGDNRDHSADSRAHLGDPGGGFIPVDDVVGKVFVVVWPPKHWGFIHRPDVFDAASLDRAASLLTSPASTGLALTSVPLTCRRKNRKRLP